MAKDRFAWVGMGEGGNSGIRRKRGCGGGRGQNHEAMCFVESDFVSALR